MTRDMQRVVRAVYRRLNRRSTLGLTWKRQGRFVTFEWEGFVSAPTIPMLFARHHYEMAIIHELVAGTGVRSSLEVGCGFGRLSPTFASLSEDHTAVDINPDALAVAATAYPSLNFRQVEGTTLPFADDAFDLVVSWTVVQHVPPPLVDELLDEILRVTAFGGRVLLCEETRLAEAQASGANATHSWHRSEAFYEGRLEPMRLIYSSYIDALDRLPGVVSPGRVMLFESPQPGSYDT